MYMYTVIVMFLIVLRARRISSCEHVRGNVWLARLGTQGITRVADVLSLSLLREHNEPVVV